MFSLIILALLFGVILTAVFMTGWAVPQGVIIIIIIGLVILSLARIIETSEED